jgi:carbon monoxide dehydrogenase subunit G
MKADARRRAEAGSGPHRLEHEIRLRAGISRVWTLLEDPDELRKWNPEIRHITPAAGGGRFGVGATFRQRIRIGLFPTTCKGEVVASSSGRRQVVVVHHALFNLTIEYLLEVVGESTRLRCRALIEGRGLGAGMPSAHIEGVTFELLEEHLEALKALAERR